MTVGNGKAIKPANHIFLNVLSKSSVFEEAHVRISGRR